jgi:hypothetical protein
MVKHGTAGDGAEDPVWKIDREMAAAGLGRTVRRKAVERRALSKEDEDSLMRAGIMISGDMQKGLSQNTHWRWEGGDNDLPQQPNGWDCGVFVVMMIACIVRGWTFGLLTRVSGVKIRVWLLETITSDSSRMRAREYAKCGIDIDWEVVTRLQWSPC